MTHFCAIVCQLYHGSCPEAIAFWAQIVTRDVKLTILCPKGVAVLVLACCCRVCASIQKPLKTVVERAKTSVPERYNIVFL